jgi:hypothetical protein
MSLSFSDDKDTTYISNDKHLNDDNEESFIVEDNNNYTSE